MAEERSTKKDKNVTGEMSFLEHLEDLRWHIVRSVLAIVICAIIAFILKSFIVDTIIMSPKLPDFWTNRMFAKLADFTGISDLRINTKELKLISISMSAQFMTHIWVSIVAGFIMASPYVIYQIWSFIKPALYDNERKYSGGAVFYMSFLLILGALFGYFLIVPLSVHFLGSYNLSDEVTNQISVTSYISVVASITLASGIIFELPIFVFFLSKIGILTPGTMKKYRRHSYVALLALSAIITPPDVYSQIMVCLPLILLYEIGIIISKRVEKKREEEFEAL